MSIIKSRFFLIVYYCLFNCLCILLYIVSIVYICQSPSPNSFYHPPFLLGIHMFVLYVYKIVYTSFFRFHIYVFSSVQSLSHVQLFVTPWTGARQAFLSITNSRRLFKLMSIELVMPSNCLILCRPLLHLPPIPPRTRVFSFFYPPIIFISWRLITL